MILLFGTALIFNGIWILLTAKYSSAYSLFRYYAFAVGTTLLDKIWLLLLAKSYPGATINISYRYRIRSFGTMLSPVEFSAQGHLTSELLRTLSMVAASKPTSWLSGQPYILSHLA